MSDIIVQGLSATVIGMGIVFLVLTILMGVLYALKAFAPKPVSAPSVVEEKVARQEELVLPEDDGDEIIAVISAAVAAYLGAGAVVKSVTPAGLNAARRSGTQAGRPIDAWKISARRENHRGLY